LITKGLTEVRDPFALNTVRLFGDCADGTARSARSQRRLPRSVVLSAQLPSNLAFLRQLVRRSLCRVHEIKAASGFIFVYRARGCVFAAMID
jgi:hypothetical protein